jgi:hypothetical protein
LIAQARALARRAEPDAAGPRDSSFVALRGGHQPGPERGR